MTTKKRIQVKDISNDEVLKAVVLGHLVRDAEETSVVKIPDDLPRLQWPYEWIMRWHPDCPEKVAYRALERCDDREFIDYGVSLRTAWLTEKGEARIREMFPTPADLMEFIDSQRDGKPPVQ